jgi:putative membrane protein
MLYHFNSGWFFIWPFGWIFFLFFLGFLSRILFGGRWGRRYHNWDHHHSHQDDPLETLKHRYARGDITKEQYDSIKSDLEK